MRIGVNFKFDQGKLIWPLVHLFAVGLGELADCVESSATGCDKREDLQVARKHDQMIGQLPGIAWAAFGICFPKALVGITEIAAIDRYEAIGHEAHSLLYGHITLPPDPADGERFHVRDHLGADRNQSVLHAGEKLALAKFQQCAEEGSCCRRVPVVEPRISRFLDVVSHV
jgi:hypothetical protein